MIVTWDEPKRLANLARHGLDFASLNVAFFLASTIVPAGRGRHMAIGLFGDAPVSVVFRVLGSEALAVISMRRASRQERRLIR